MRKFGITKLKLMNEKTITAVCIHMSLDHEKEFKDDKVDSHKHVNYFGSLSSISDLL